MSYIIEAILQATLVSQCVLVLLLCMSIASWSYMGAKWLQLRTARKQNQKLLKSFDEAESVETALGCVQKNHTATFFSISRRGIREFNRLSRTGDAATMLNDNVRRALHFGIAEEMSKMATSLALLATAANTAPFIGLFGTVWGIMHSFHAIAAMKSVSLATVAPGIAEALIATAAGLFVAIPATFGYNIFRAKLNAIQMDCISFAGMLLNRLRHEGVNHPEGIPYAQEGE